MKLFLLILINFGIQFFQSWVQFGATTVRFSATKDVVYPKNTNHFEKIKFVVGGAPISLEDATVIYTDGTNEIIHILSVVTRGGESRQLPLKNDSTDIRQVNITYKAAKGFGDQNAKITIWGMPKSF